MQRALIRPRPIYTGCSLQNVAGAGTFALYPRKPFASFTYDSTSTTTATTPPEADFVLAIKEIAVRRIIILADTGLAGTTFVFKNPNDESAAYTLTLDGTAGETAVSRVIEFPDGGLRFPHGVGLDSNRNGNNFMIVYDWIR